MRIVGACGVCGDNYSVTGLKERDAEFMARRRQLLRLGAAGVPMVLTLRASAADTVHSALDCAFVLTQKVRMLVDETGKVWVSDKNLKYKNGKGYKISDVSKFKNEADYVFPAGSAPSDYRPEACPEPEGCGSGDDDWWGDDDWGDRDWGEADMKLLGNAASDNLSDVLQLATWGWQDDDDDSCDDDDNSGGDSKYVDCGYNLYKVGKNTTITPADYLSSSGSWNLNGSKGLYLALAGKYLDSNGNDGGFPGISCLLSILNYLDTQT